MVYEQFLDHICNLLEEKMKKGSHLQRQKVQRNNGVCSDSLYVAGDGLILSPSIGIAPYYEEYQEGRLIGDIADELYKQLTEVPPKLNFDLGGLSSFGQQKERVVFRLIHYKDNEEMLKQLPHKRWHDLAVIFCLYLQETEEGCITAMIKNEQLEQWNCTVDQLYAAARVNTPRLLPWRLQSLEGMLNGLMEQELGMEEELLGGSRQGGLPELFVLTNASGIYGASCILYEAVLENLADSFLEDLYILPSSIHEVILVPAKPEFTLERLEGIVAEANQTAVDEEERLSDKVYLYSRLEKRILDKRSGTC